MSSQEKARVLADLIACQTIPTTIRVNGGGYRLNEGLWHDRGLIVYGITANVNAMVAVTGSGNYKEGQYRYWGFDMNGGLYANDSFPRDSDSGTPAWQKNWLSRAQISANPTARRYIGEFALGSAFSSSDVQATAEAFLEKNPAWSKAGLTAAYIAGHFYFNAVLSETGLTQGQFIGVHKSKYNGRLYYQTFSVEGPVKLFEVPPETPAPQAPPSGPGDPPVLPTIPPAPPSEPPATPGDPPASAAQVEIDCRLGLPAVTYVGHPTPAYDQSGFKVNGESWSAGRVYEAGLASNSFTVGQAGASIHRIGPDRALITFRNEGRQMVDLAVTPARGSTVHDIQTIEVKKTPAILATLTGTQKQNRKQSLNLRIAKAVNSRLVRLEIKLTHVESGETVQLEHRFDGSVNQLVNGPTIKTRPVVKLDSDDYFACFRLDFLTKNTSAADYRYEVYAEDEKGNHDQVAVDFPVAADQPPEAAILMEAAYVRQRDSNQAIIDTMDDSRTDGDQIERSWFYRPAGQADWQAVANLPAYCDLSFGRGKHIEFGKNAVGPFEVLLKVRDHWTEETLEEYVSQEDRLTAEATAASEVINVAPLVSLKAKPLKNMRVVFIAGDEAEYRQVIGRSAEWVSELLQDGLAVDLAAEKLPAAPSANHGAQAQRKFTVETPFGYEGNWTFYEDKNFIVDETGLYKISASWPSTDIGGYPQSPYTIACWRGSGSVPEWTFSFTDQLMTVPNRDCTLAQDDIGRYLCFSNGQKTLLLDKSSGAFLTVLDFNVGEQLYAGKACLYALKTDGLYRIDLKNGSVKRFSEAKAVNGPGGRVGGLIHFAVIHNNSLQRGMLDPESGRLRFEKWKGAVPNPLRAEIRSLGVDRQGRIILQTTKPNRSATGAVLHGYQVQIFKVDRENQVDAVTAETAVDYPLSRTFTPVMNEAGRYRYLAEAWQTRSGQTHLLKWRCSGLDDGSRTDASLSAYNHYPADSRKVAFAREIGGKIYYAAGAEWICVANTGYHIYKERTQTFIFDPVAETIKQGKLQSRIGLPDDLAEYSCFSQGLAAVQTGDNGQTTTNGSKTHVLTWQRTLADLVGQTVDRTVRRTESGNLVVLCPKAAAGDLTGLAGHLKKFNTGLIILEGENWADEEVRQKLIGGSGQKPMQLAVQAAEGRPAELSRNFQLEANCEHRYEYLTDREPLMVDGEKEPAVRLTLEHQSEMLNGACFKTGDSRWLVTEAHSETFTDQKIEPFFSLDTVAVSDGYYKGADVQITGDSNRYVSAPWPAEGKTAIRFTIPEGKSGLLSFDYLLEKEQMISPCNWMAAGVKIDGQWWQAATPQSGIGRYSHPELLSAGEHTLTFHAAAYGSRGTSAKLWLDQLNLDIVEEVTDESAGQANEVAPESPPIVEKMADGYWKVSGSFRTPPTVLSYNAVENATLYRGPVGEINSQNWLRWVSQEPGRRQVVMDIPQGQAALDLLLTTQSRTSASNRNNYNVIYRLPRPRPGHPRAGLEWRCLAKLRNPADPLYHFSHDGRIAPGVLAGPQHLSINSAETHGARGDITEGRAVLVADALRDWQDRRHWLSAEDLIMEEKRYRESRLCFRLPPGLSGIRQFRLFAEKAGEEVLLTEAIFSDTADLNEWQADHCQTAVLPATVEKPAEGKIVYRKGEPIVYDIQYFDYEGDPSKKQYWKYSHTPFNDGVHPEAAVILDDDYNVQELRSKILSRPIERFEIDGRYIVEHWQEDDTGNAQYDRLSNVERQVFYVEGEGSAPRIKSIRTIPAGVTEGTRYRLQIELADKEKDELTLSTKVYKGGEEVFSERKTGIKANAAGSYPPVRTELSDAPAEAGRYEVVCTVRDWSGAGVGHYRFDVLSSGKIAGRVSHTDEWERNRKKFNLHYFKEEHNKKSDPAAYLTAKAPRRRGGNVFWSGEKLILTAEVYGSARRVTAQTLAGAGEKSYQAVLNAAGAPDQAGRQVYRGELWDAAMISQWGRARPQAVTIRFTAYYGDGRKKTFDEVVIFDSGIDYWLLHRIW
jgi:hypothetical protein